MDDVRRDIHTLTVSVAVIRDRQERDGERLALLEATSAPTSVIEDLRHSFNERGQQLARLDERIRAMKEHQQQQSDKGWALGGLARILEGLKDGKPSSMAVVFLGLPFTLLVLVLVVVAVLGQVPEIVEHVVGWLTPAVEAP